MSFGGFSGFNSFFGSNKKKEHHQHHVPPTYPSQGYPQGPYGQPTSGYMPPQPSAPPAGIYPQGPYGQPPPTYPPQQVYSTQPSYPPQPGLTVGADFGGVHVDATFGGAHAMPFGYLHPAGKYIKTSGAFGKTNYHRHPSDPNPQKVIRVEGAFMDKVTDLGGGYAKCKFKVFYEGHQLEIDGTSDDFQVTDVSSRTASDGRGNIYINGVRQ